MQLKPILVQRRATIIKQWFDAVVDTYPTETARFLRREKDPFANPVGQTTVRGLEILFDELLADMSPPAIQKALDPIIRIRALQDFTPSRATAFIFQLKQIVRTLLASESGGPFAGEEVWALECRVDQLAQMAFDLYMGCREKLYDLKANEARAHFYQALERAGLLTTGSTDGADEPPSNGHPG